MAIGFAVFDFETTGFGPSHKTSALELGIIQLDPSGREEGRWESVIRPYTDHWTDGAARTHLLRKAQIQDAPSFEELAHQISAVLENRILVGHYVRSDFTLLREEYKRIGAPISDAYPRFCTRNWARSQLNSISHRLKFCCKLLGIPLENAHRALADTEATAELFRHALNGAMANADDAHVFRDKYEGYESEVRDGPLTLREIEAIACPPLPRGSEHKRSAMTREDLNMKPPTAAEIHAAMRAEEAQCAKDAAKAASEKASSSKKKGSGRKTSQATSPKALLATIMDSESIGPMPQARLQPGDLIVMTGKFTHKRDLWGQLCVGLGLEFKTDSVTMNTKYLVAADPNKGSGKIEKARKYNIDILSEEEFMSILRASVNDGSLTRPSC